MKTIIAGSRKCDSYGELLAAIRISNFDITEVVSGCAKGIDTLGEQWAVTHNIPIKRFPVTKDDWVHIGKSAAMIRNGNMADYSDALIAIWDGKSSGTKDMIIKARKKGLKVCVWNYIRQQQEFEQLRLF